MFPVVPDSVVARNYLKNNASIASCFLYSHVVAGVRPVQIFPHDLLLQFDSLFGFRNNTSISLSSNTNVWSSVDVYREVDSALSSHVPKPTRVLVCKKEKSVISELIPYRVNHWASSC